jgi:hypothetical protein
VPTTRSNEPVTKRRCPGILVEIEIAQHAEVDVAEPIGVPVVT